MSVGGNRSPYRPPCGSDADAPEVYWLGGPWQHYVGAHSAIPRYKNTTLVPDYRDPSCDGYSAGGIIPYQRVNSHTETGGGCQPSSTDGGGDGSDCDILCGPWPEPVAANTYAAYDPAETISQATCRKIGFKIVFARKAWHGRFGFNTQNDHCCAFDADEDCCHHDIVSSPPTTKYRTLSWTASATEHQCFVPEETIVTALSGSCSVDQYSGKITVTGTATVTRTPDSGGDPTIIDISDGSNDLANAMLAAIAPFCAASYSQTFTNDEGVNDSVNNASAENGLGGVLTVTASETSYSREWTGTVLSSGGCDTYLNYSISATLSDAYTSDDVNDDKDTLLAEWDLSDDAQYPWRADGLCTSGPLVTYFEYGPNFPTPMYATFVDTSPCDGSILGSPNPAGYDPYFDFRFVTWDLGSSEECEGCWQVFDYGDYAPTWAPYATQWTDKQAASALLPCAFNAYNVLLQNLTCCNDPVQYSGGSLVGSKYAEVILLTQPSHDFARPCGPKDAATIEQVGLDCTTSPPSGTLRWSGIENPCPVPPDDGGDWNDNYPKGEWCLVEWNFNYRDIGEAIRIQTGGTGDTSGNTLCEANPDETIPRPVTGPWSAITCTQECSQFLPCCPAAVYLVPNSTIEQPESAGASANSQVFTIPKLGLDDTYGSRWQMAPFQWMTDPLWQPPQPPCDHESEDGFQWLEDDGSGQTDSDTNWYYAQQPWEECRCSLPDGAPTLTDGYLGTMSVADINAASATLAQIGESAEALVINGSAVVVGKTIQYPAAGQCYMPWWTWAINRAAATRFHCEYADPLAICSDDPEVETSP